MRDSSIILDSDFNRSWTLASLYNITAPRTSKAVPTSSRLSPHKPIKSVLKLLREAYQFLTLCCQSSILQRSNSPSIEKGKSTGKLEQLLDGMLADSRGLAQVLKWFRPRAIDYDSDVFSAEIDAAKEDLQGALDIITPEVLLTWDLNLTMDSAVAPKAPVLRRLLHRQLK
ncbi:hypothetical protein BDR04DRAFT_1164233 [Suillus decipiens]|nr:hypothetical protein BDR04DRAFT_1164233 [Suillus decipiens]